MPTSPGSAGVAGCIVARGVGALMLGTLVGALIGRVLPAILAAALVMALAFTGLSFAQDRWLEPRRRRPASTSPGWLGSTTAHSSSTPGSS